MPSGLAFSLPDGILSSPSVVRMILLSLLIGLVVTVVANIATTVFLHRAMAHRALALSSVAAVAFRALIWVTTGIRPRQWVAVHRKHHAFTDVEGDPHSPVLLGWKNVQMKNVALYRRCAADPRTISRYAKDMPPTKLDTLLFDRPVLGLVLGIVSLCVVFGPVVGLVASFVHVNLYLGGSAAVNAIGHHFGRKPYDNGAGNLQWLAFLTAGEGLHNNHHAAPTSARLSHRWYEIDYGWWVIKLLTWTRLARVRLGEIKVIGAPKRVAA
mgnify:FL=1